jgi:16S rRNA processing protein RimM
MEKIIIGEVVNTHGVKGELKVRSFSDFMSDRLKRGNSIYLGDLMLRVEYAKEQTPGWLVKFVGYDDLNSVEAFKTKQLSVDKAILPRLPHGQYYFFELVGCLVYDQHAVCLGSVIKVESTGYQELLRIDTGSKQVLIPFIPPFIHEVNLGKKSIIVHTIAGLI